MDVRSAPGEASRKLLADAGCDGFLPKPIDVGALFEALERHLDLTWIRATPVSEIRHEPLPSFPG